MPHDLDPPVAGEPLELLVDDHPLLDLGAFVTAFPRPLGELPPPRWLARLLASPEDDGAGVDEQGQAGGGVTMPTGLGSTDEVRRAVRDLLRPHGYKPTGRGKPSAEYLLKAASQGTLESINLVVDACNAVSLHSGLPVSVVDLDRVVSWPAGAASGQGAGAVLRVAVATKNDAYVFNPAGQTIDVAGLPCLRDAEGACANAVKDAQRTKTSTTTRRTLSLVWGTAALTGRTALAVSWYRRLLEEAGASTAVVTLRRAETSG